MPRIHNRLRPRVARARYRTLGSIHRQQRPAGGRLLPRFLTRPHPPGAAGGRIGRRRAANYITNLNMTRGRYGNSIIRGAARPYRRAQRQQQRIARNAPVSNPNPTVANTRAWTTFFGPGSSRPDLRRKLTTRGWGGKARRIKGWR